MVEIGLGLLFGIHGAELRAVVGEETVGVVGHELIHQLSSAVGRVVSRWSH